MTEALTNITTIIISTHCIHAARWKCTMITFIAAFSNPRILTHTFKIVESIWAFSIHTWLQKTANIIRDCPLQNGWKSDLGRAEKKINLGDKESSCRKLEKPQRFEVLWVNAFLISNQEMKFLWNNNDVRIVHDQK